MTEPSSAAIAAHAVPITPAHSYRRAPPALAGCWCPDPDLMAYFLNVIRQRDAHCPAEYILPLPRAYVFDAQYVLTSDGQWLADSIVDYPGAAEALPAIQQRIATGDVQHLPQASVPTVMFAKAGALNYGHAVVEMLPRLINLHRSSLRRIRLLVPDGMAKFAPTLQRLMEAMGITAELLPMPHQQLVAVDSIVYLGPVSQHNTRKSTTLLALRDMVWNTLGVRPQPQRKFFVERPAHENRGLENADEVRALLEERGFETIHPAVLPFEEQVALFAQASHILGPLGAGLANTIFAPAGCRVTMIDPGLADYFFWDLAALAAQPFTWLFTGPIMHYSWDLASRRYTVDPNALRYVLDKFQ